MLVWLRQWAASMRRNLVVISCAARDPRVPLAAKLLAAATLAYALSPIDLIPDFIPVLGMLDDLILVPLGIYLALRLIPDEVLEDLRQTASRQFPDRRTSLAGAIAVIVIWIVLAALLVRFALSR